MSFEWNTKERLDAIDAALSRIQKQNDAIIAALKSQTHLSPIDQAKLNTIFATVTGDSAKIDKSLPGK